MEQIHAESEHAKEFVPQPQVFNHGAQGFYLLFWWDKAGGHN